MSEIDTQVLLVEPILAPVGWDISDFYTIRRASRSPTNKQFGIEIYTDVTCLRIAIECKALASREFNIGKMGSPNGVGATHLEKRGNGTLYWKNDPGDGVGQMRAYCLKYPQSPGLPPLIGPLRG